MTRTCRQACTGEGFDHDATVMSIAVAGALLRCPICGAEAEYSRSRPAGRHATPGVDGGRPPA
jgi:hypothetical protein